MDMAPEDITRSEQESACICSSTAEPDTGCPIHTQAKQTVRKQLVEALRAVAIKFHHSLDHTIAFEDCYVPECYDARHALDRARAEPECACDGPECPGYDVGVEAKRDRW